MARTRTEEPKIRLVQPSGEEKVVLTSKRGRVRLKGMLRNEGSEPVRVSAASIVARVPAAGNGTVTPVLEPWDPLVVEPSEAQPASLTATLDPRTPPGTYEAEVVIEGVVHEALLQVTEQIALRLSEAEVIVTPDGSQTRHVVATNTGNVPLELRRIGPAELVPDHPRPSLLQRLGVLPYDETEWVYPYEPDETVPTVSAHLTAAVELAPGETEPLELVVTVDGPLRPGVRYRATAPVYTTDLAFVVTPSQDLLGLPGVSPPAPPGPAPAEPNPPSSAPSSRQKRRNP